MEHFNQTIGRAKEEIGLLGLLHLLQSKIAKSANKWITQKEIELKAEQIPVIMIISKNKNITQQEIANQLERDKSSIFRTINSLSSKGLISISKDPDNGRQNFVNMTKKGEELMVEIQKEICEFETTFIEKLTPTNYSLLLKNLNDCNLLLNELNNDF